MIDALPPSLQKMASSYQAGTISLGDWRKQLKTLPPEQANLLMQFSKLVNQATGFSSALQSGGPAAQTYQAALAKATGDATGLNTALMLTGENTAYVNGALKAVGSATTEGGNHVKGWAEIQQTFNQRLSQTKAALGAVGIEIGNALMPYAQKALTVVQASVTWLTKHKTVAKDLAVTIGILAAGFVAFRLVMLGVNVVSKAWLVIQTAAKVATTAWTAAQALANSTMGIWIGIQAINFAGWVRQAATVIANTAALVAYTVAQTAVKVATTVWTAVQWLLDASLWASGIPEIIIGVALLVAAIVLIATKTTWFQTAWKATWDFLKAVAAWFAGPFAHFFVAGYDAVVHAAGVTISWLHSAWSSVINFFTGMPGKISHIASGMWDGIKNAFRAAIDWIIDGWNRLHFAIPSVSFLGFHSPSFTLGVPHIPRLAGGGIATSGGLAMVGERGAEIVSLPAGAAVHPHGTVPAGGGAVEMRVTGNTGGAFVTAFKQLCRSGDIQFYDSSGQRVSIV